MAQLTDEIARVKDAPRHRAAMLLLGHSMGAAVAMHYAAEHPDDVLGVLYRDGVATPVVAAPPRRGRAAARTARSPTSRPSPTWSAAAALDLPDLLAGHAFATIRSMLPDLRHNVRTFARSAPDRVDADAPRPVRRRAPRARRAECPCWPSGAASTGSSRRRPRRSSPRSPAWTCTGSPAVTPGCSRGPTARPTCSRRCGGDARSSTRSPVAARALRARRYLT